MERITPKALSSISQILFRLLEKYEIYDEVFEMKITPLNDEDLLVKHIAQEVYDFFNLLSLEIAWNEEEQEAKENPVLKNVENLMADELALIESLNDPEYIRRLNEFFSNWRWRGELNLKIQTVLEKASERQKWYRKFEEDHTSYFIRLNTLFEIIPQIYEKHNGEPNQKPYIPCPQCERKVDSYGCAWGYNNHIHFYCEHCGTKLMQ